MFVAFIPSTDQWTDPIPEAHLTVVYSPDDKVTDEILAAAINVCRLWAENTHPFTMEVLGSGRLGPHNALVQYHETGAAETALQETLEALLGGTEHGGEWKPHITIGYPEGEVDEQDHRHPTVMVDASEDYTVFGALQLTFGNRVEVWPFSTEELSSPVGEPVAATSK